jgi:UDP-N-acetylmuramate--alanine ligase
VDRKLIRYGLASDADVVATEVEIEGFQSRFVAHAGGGRLGPVELPLPGRHAVVNALAAIAVGLEVDLPFATIARALARFRGVERRMQLRGEVAGVRVLDDYGHHPTEIQATLAAIRAGFGSRTLVVFQPHRYTRTRALLEEFGRAFALADRVIVTAIYAAGEPPIVGIDGRLVAETLTRHGHPAVSYAERLEEAAARLRELAQPGDIVLTLGAGDVWKAGEQFLRAAHAAPGTPPGRRARA